MKLPDNYKKFLEKYKNGDFKNLERKDNAVWVDALNCYCLSDWKQLSNYVSKNGAVVSYSMPMKYDNGWHITDEVGANERSVSLVGFLSEALQEIKKQVNDYVWGLEATDEEKMKMFGYFIKEYYQMPMVFELYKTGFEDENYKFPKMPVSDSFLKLVGVRKKIMEKHKIV